MKHILTKIALSVSLTVLFSLSTLFSKAQTTLNVGDIAFTGYISSDPTLPDQFSFVTFVNMSSGTTIKFTDFGWRSSGGFNSGLGTESEITFTTTIAIAAGKEITISGTTASITGSASSPGTVVYSTGGNFFSPLSLSSGGDQLFAYQNTFASPNFITGIHMNVYCAACTGDPTTTNASVWDGALVSPYVNANTSEKPPALTTGVNAIWIGTEGVQLSEKDNARFNCSGNLTTVAGIKAAIYAGTAPTTFSNWTTSDATAGFTLPANCVFLATPAPAITQQPASQSKCSGSPASFSIIASNATGYQWQLNSGGGFNNLTNTAPYSNVTTATLSISSVTNAMNGYQYRCIASGTSPDATSNAATLTVNPIPSLTNSSTASTCTGTGPNITLTASVPSTFAWTLGTNTGGITGASASSGPVINQTLTNPSSTTAGSIVYNVTPTSTTGSCPGSPAPITVTVNIPTSFTLHPVNTGACSGSGSTSFTATAIGPGVVYSWQADIGLGYQTISNNATFSGAGTNTLTITNPGTIFNGAPFRCVATGTCGTVNSNPATLTIDPVGTNTWKGSIDNTWENAGNWRCGVVPDLNTDVVIPSGATVTLNSNRSCRTLTVRPGATFTAKAGFKLTVVH